MKNKMKILRVIGIVLITVLPLIGCEEEAPEGRITIGNNCDNYKITRISLWGEGGTDINETLSLDKGQSKSWTVPNNRITFSKYTFTVEVTPSPASNISEDRLSNQSIQLLGDSSEATRILHIFKNLSPNPDKEYWFEWRGDFQD